MSTEIPTSRVCPVYRRPNAERHAHVAMRMKERGGIEWTPEQVLALERKIRFVRGQLNLGKPVASILPTKFAEDKEGTIHHYRVLIKGESHTFIFSQLCRGLVSYIGRGEIQPRIAAQPAPEVAS